MFNNKCFDKVNLFSFLWQPWVYFYTLWPNRKGRMKIENWLHLNKLPQCVLSTLHSPIRKCNKCFCKYKVQIQERSKHLNGSSEVAQYSIIPVEKRLKFPLLFVFCFFNKNMMQPIEFNTLVVGILNWAFALIECIE